MVWGTVNIAILGAALLEAEHSALNEAQQKVGILISAAMTHGPTGICLGTSF
jgi:hypothetical protein